MNANKKEIMNTVHAKTDGAKISFPDNKYETQSSRISNNNNNNNSINLPNLYAII